MLEKVRQLAGERRPLGPMGDTAMQSRQDGMTLIGFLFVLAAVLFVAYIGMKLVPVYLNHMSVVSVLKTMNEVPGAANMSEGRIRDLLSRKFTTSYVEHVRPQDIQIVRGGGTRLVAAYEVRVSLVGNLDAVAMFEYEQSLQQAPRQ